MSTNDDGEARRAQHQRALLHNAPQAPPREPNPGELLMKFEHGQDVFRVELRDFQPNGVETQIFQNGKLLTACRFTVRALARRLGRAEARRDSQRGRPVNDLPDDQKVRRYMSFSRFVWLLQFKQLWMARVDLLGDPWEMVLAGGQLAHVLTMLPLARDDMPLETGRRRWRELLALLSN